MEDGYTLLDFGEGRRLEQWGMVMVNRPDISATGRRLLPERWNQADLYFAEDPRRSHQGKWQATHQSTEKWTINIGKWTFAVGVGSTKQLGLFPEQAEQWKMIDDKIRQAINTDPSRQLSVFNGFAYTGAASIVAALAGAKVTHIDSNAAAIGRAKQNQALNLLPSDCIRWIKDDVLTFMRREVNREHSYDIIMLDPPAYGHGPKGETFSLIKDLPELLTLSRTLLSPKPLFFLLTTYADGLTPLTVSNQLQQILGVPMKNIDSHYLTIPAATGKNLTTSIGSSVNFD